MSKSNNTHLAAEYFVAAELYRRGFDVGMTLGNAKDIDILVYKDGKQLAVQVKSMQNRSSNCPIKNVVKDVIYVFVNLNCNKDGFLPPEYYVCTAKEAEQVVTKHPTRSNVYVRTLEKTGYKDRWDKLEK